ncbi:trk system potassium uptake protein TrkA [Thermosulfidibacter takaii ABI70S6]|uniref:Trk system potassium uptake protein TrkA n=1 Tax=Thermosulfidibacter takaii (strain DSM 17441 / JCM 13301 / NBRC 103674 / ABI70S6) TaxID=1298851 RepID=A0A0S3QRY3_THET7|nr:TrkA family potassium uptake protein [Thermosulfidibacter takaii]BAT71092.1 trk system potassium uptake protein TrkA [Thermosulfidibacter takaii ABI70S6]
MKYFAVIGIGRFGYSVAKTLTEMGCQVLAIDKSEERLRQLEGVVTQVVQADATDEKALRAAGIKDVDAVIVAIGQNMEASILVSLILKELGVPYIVSKAINRLHAKVLERIGCDRVVLPEEEMGIRVARSLVSPNVMDELDLSEKVRIYEIKVPGVITGKTLGELDFRKRFGLNVVAVKSKDGSLETSPTADTMLKEGDYIFVIGDEESMEDFEKQLKKMEKKK